MHTLQNISATVNELSVRRFIKRPIGLDGKQKLDGLTRTQTAIYLVIQDAAANKVYTSIYLSHDTIAKRAQCSRKTVVNAMRRLKDTGYIDFESRGRIMVTDSCGKKRPKNLTNNYWLTEKILHVLPCDVLTGRLRDVAGEEEMQPVLSEKGKKEMLASIDAGAVDADLMTQNCTSGKKGYGILRESISKDIDTLDSANAEVQNAAQDKSCAKGIADEEGGGVREGKTSKTAKDREHSANDAPNKCGELMHEAPSKSDKVEENLKPVAKMDGSGIDHEHSEIRTETLKTTPNLKGRTVKGRQAPISPLLRDHAIHVWSNYCAMRKAAGFAGDKIIMEHQYAQVAHLIEHTGGRDGAIKYCGFVLNNWTSLIGSTGPMDAANLAATPNLNQMLAPFRIKIWWGRMNGIQSKKTLRKKTRQAALIEKLRLEIAELKSGASCYPGIKSQNVLEKYNTVRVRL